MIYPSIDQLTRGIYNRYELVIATAKAARKITDAQVSKREELEKSLGGKDSPQDKLYARLEPIVVDEKAVKIAIQKIYEGDFIIIKSE